MDRDLRNEGVARNGALPTFVYVLTGAAAGLFPRMVYLSASALRRLYPSARVLVVTDPESASFLQGGEFPELLRFVELRSVTPRSSNPEAWSRELKTRLRSELDGDLVYLDADTLPLRHFDELFRSGAEFAAVLDRSQGQRLPGFPDWARAVFHEMGWRVTQRYFNSGVLYLPDLPGTRALGAEWASRWESLVARTGVARDQPALNSSLDALGTRCRVLPVEFNAMVETWPYAARRARILHFFADDGYPAPDSLLAKLLRGLSVQGRIDWAAITRARNSGDAWVHPGGGFHRAIALGRYGRALHMLARHVARRVGLDSVRALASRTFVADDSALVDYLTRRLGESARVLGPIAIPGSLSTTAATRPVFVLTHPVEAYAAYARQSAEETAARGGVDAVAAQHAFLASWCGTVGEYVRCVGAGQAPVLLRRHAVRQDVEATGDGALEALFAELPRRRARAWLSTESRRRIVQTCAEELAALASEWDDY